MNFTVIDWIFGIVIIIFAIGGLLKGFINNIFGKLAWILAIITSSLFYGKASEMFFSGIANDILKKILGFLLVFVVMFLIIKFIQIIVSKLFEWNILKSLDRTLGIFFGIIEGFAIIGIFIFLLTIQPFFNSEVFLADSFFYNLLNQVLINSKEVKLNV